MSQPGPMGWGLANETESKLHDMEKRALDELANLAPSCVMRHETRDPKNEALLATVRDQVKAAGWDDGMILPFLFKEATKLQPAWLRQLIGSCFPAGTMVRMADGSEKPIDQIKVGDYVVGHSGEARKVNHTFCREYTGELHEFDVFGNGFNLTATHCHRIATVPWDGWRYDRKTADLEAFDWTRAEHVTPGQDRFLVGSHVVADDLSPVAIDVLELAGDGAVLTDDILDGISAIHNRPSAARLHMQRNGGDDLRGRVTISHGRMRNAVLRHVSLTPCFARLLGLYCAEGGTDGHRITFTFSSKEVDTLAEEVLVLMRGVFGIEGEKRHEPEKGRTTVRFDSTVAARVFKSLVPGNVYDKSVPRIIWQGGRNIRLAFIKGWADGDGNWKRGKYPRMTGVTVSRSLASGIQYLAGTCGLIVSSRTRKARKQSKQAYEVCVSGNDFDILNSGSGVLTKTCKRHSVGTARKVRSVTKHIVERMKVYDIEVDQDHSFLANGLIVHNCVASGDMRTTAYRMVAEIFVFNDPEELPGSKFSGPESLAFFAPYSYRAGRKLAGINGNSDGSLCLPHIRGKMQFGHLPCNAQGLRSDAFPEPQSQSDYKRWGANDTLLNQFAAQANPFKLLESEPVKSVADIHELICTHLKPANICSMWGFRSSRRPLGQDANGATINQWTRSGQWAHNMSVVGHVKRGGAEFVIIENSWGNFHDGSTCFAVEASEMDRWLRQAECQSVGEIDLKDNAPAIDWGTV